MIIPPGFVAIFARFTNAVGHACENVCGYAVSDPPGQTEADAAGDWLGTAYKGWLNPASHFTGVHILVGNDGELGALDSANGAGVGTRGGDLEAPQVNALIKKFTTVAGRHGRGRIYLPDVHKDQVNDDGGQHGAYLDPLEAIATAWMTLSDADAIFTEPVLLHSTSLAPTTITAMASEVKVCTQRRRFRR